eukprot:5924846-Prymnesium_polylepis.1
MALAEGCTVAGASTARSGTGTCRSSMLPLPLRLPPLPLALEARGVRAGSCDVVVALADVGCAEGREASLMAQLAPESAGTLKQACRPNQRVRPPTLWTCCFLRSRSPTECEPYRCWPTSSV